MKKVREGYKMTEIGEIPEEWEVKSLKEITEIITKGTTPTTYGFQFQDDGINFIKVENIDEQGKIIKDNFLKISKECHEKLSRSKIKEGDILLSIAGTLGRATIVPREIVPANTNQALSIIRIKDKQYNKSFIYYILKSEYLKRYIKSISTVGAQPNLSLAQVGNFMIPVPLLNEQKKITSILSTVDELIEKTDEIIEKTKELKKGLMQKLLTKGIGHSKFKMTEIGEIPEEWEVKSLQAVSELITRGKGPKYVDRSPYIVINQKCIRWEGLDLNFVKYMDENAWFKLNDKYKLKYMDVVINSTGTGTLGRATIFREKNNKFMADSHVTIIRTKSEELDPTYLMYYLQTDKCQNDIYSYCISGSTNQIELAKSKFETPIPPQQEQRQIASILSAVDEKIEAEEKRKEQLLQLKKGLMQQLLTGRVRVKV